VDEDPGIGLTELAERSGVPSRTIRYYQSQHLLEKPTKHGRDAVYTEDHLDRLRLIAELQDRGLTLNAIGDLLARKASPGVSVGDWLGLDETLRGPWSEDRPLMVDEEGLDRLTGPQPTGFKARLERAGYAAHQPDGATWLIPSPRLLELAVRLQDAGIHVEASGKATDLLRRRLNRAVDDLIALFVDNAGAGFPIAGGLENALDTLRPVARESAGIILAQEIERGLRAILDADPGALGGRRR
jgi:DNA-binding transcriptional MerR regulator